MQKKFELTAFIDLITDNWVLSHQLLLYKNQFDLNYVCPVIGVGTDFRQVIGQFGGSLVIQW